MDSPCVLVASCTEFSPFDLAKQILTADALPDPRQRLEGILAYPWHINTKYYTANVDICVTEKRTIGDQKFAESVEAFIVYFDSKDVGSFEQVRSWLPFIKEIEPSVQMLICECCDHSDAVPRQRVLKWCLDNTFELVELNPVQDSGSEEDDFQETTGMKRIIQALHAHTWSNLEMKDRPAFRSPYFEQLMVEEKAEKDAAKLQSGTNTENSTDSADNSQIHAHSIDNIQGELSKSLAGASKPDSEEAVTQNANSWSTSANDKETGGASDDMKVKKGEKTRKSKEQIQEEKIDSLIKDDDLSMLAALGNNESDHETFEELFAKMRIMKETAESLPAEERKLYAEKVAISFWKAIGGDEDEIEGLDSDDGGGMD
ncbi:alpha- and gamma-adaptin-binding protein p34 [Lingula anatina]|uniref:Alpha- and gamma-adaptin-binding protein p34 n=1 Tax=Lingula anatina TaxID=7574 RepID=A0A1S3I544_LINAN|nr:alpha- and gamma-adaptin-binding protein p34 [Lingula anatina]|eukprot:XP_013393387.1 alpha- and gamma-adaptin-binding protein p34 [Lingula anatina]